MRRVLSLLFFVSVALVAARTVAVAQTLTLEITDGLVTLDAQNVSVRQVLERWAQVGGVTVINADKISAAPVTLTLSGLPERTALETLLRGVSGYILGARQQAAGTATRIDRIVLVPGAAAPRNVAGSLPPAPPPVSFRSPNPFAAALSASAPADDTGDSFNPSPDPGDDTTGTFGNERPARASRTAAQGPDAAARPASMPIRFSDALDENGERVRAVTIPSEEQPPAEASAGGQAQRAPGQGGRTTTAKNPFGISSGSARPGTITPVPKQQER